MATIKDIARIAEVSISTVSNALNGGNKVGEETRNRILKIAEELNYVPNINAKLLRNRKTNNIGLFLPNIRGSFYLILIQEMYRICQEGGYGLVININDKVESKELATTILSGNIDGAIILHEKFNDNDIEMLEKNNMPVVFLDKEVSREKISSVLINNFQGMELAVDYMRHTKHNKIAFIRGTENYDDITRYNAFINAMERNSMEIDNDLIMNGYFSESGAYNAVRASFYRGHIVADAIVCENDEMARGAINALQDANIKVPEEVSVIGFDDTDIARYCNPPITSIKSPISELGVISVEEVLKLINEEKNGEIIFLDTKIVIRDSSAYKI